MQTTFEEITIEVPALTPAQADFERLLGCEGQVITAGVRFPLGNTVLLLRENAAQEASEITGLLLGVPAFDAHAPKDVANPLGLSLSAVAAPWSDSARQDPQQGGDSLYYPRLDHLVLRTTQAEDCIALFGDQLGMRLALDQEVPEWGGRMLFFRSGKLTLEIISPHDAPVPSSAFWGLSIQVADLAATAERLQAAGVQLSELRQGRKAGTRVATVHSHNLGLPTLLLEHCT